MTDIETTESTNTELTDQQMDDLVERVESPKGEPAERAMTKEPEAPVKEDLIEFTHNGKQIKGTRDQLIKWAQQGYDYPQKAQKLNQDKAKWEADRQKWEQSYSPYKQIDDWAKKNPEAWQKMQESWKQAQAAPAATTSDPYATKFQSLEAKLNQFEQVINPVVEKLSTAEQQEHDQKLDQEIQSIREKHKDLDWTTIDENGKSLEYKVLEHAQKNGIRNFTTAFKDFCHDELISRAEAQAKLNVSKDIQTKSKLGILGTSPTPKKGISVVKDVRSKSYNDIEAEIREELRSGAYN